MLIFLHPPLAGSGLLARIKAAFFYLHRRRSVLFLYPHLPYLPFFFFLQSCHTLVQTFRSDTCKWASERVQSPA